jgi:Curli production assembly/transport component CsgG
MKQLLITYLILIAHCVSGQNFDFEIQAAADSLSKKIIASGKTRVAVGEFENLDGSKNQLCTFLADEIAGGLANKTENQTKFRILERANLDLIFEEKKLIKSTNSIAYAMQLGALDAADILVYGVITDFEGYYRVNIKLLDTKHGEVFSSYKINFVKNPSMEKLYKSPLITMKVEMKTVDTIVQPQPTQVTDKGDICFKNQIDWCNAEVKIFDMKGVKVGSTSVRGKETSCIYELPVGIYKVEIESCGQAYNSKQVTSEQVKVEKGVSKQIVIHH